MKSADPNRLVALYDTLFGHYGPQHWWPADTPFEVAVGAILTQNTAWLNVERAIGNLRTADVLHPAALLQLSRQQLEALLRPAGFFRQKADRLYRFAAWVIEEHDGRIENALNGDLDQVRATLLAFNGIGPETADSILLYAGGHATFVVDAYTRRLLTRLGDLAGNESYATIRDCFMRSLPREAALYNEYHALIVVHCKACCHKRRPGCSECPVEAQCRRRGVD